MLGEWARDFRAPLLRYFQKRAPATVEPEDLVQEVFVRLARRANLASINQIEGYLFQTAASVLADRYRRDAVRQETAHQEYEDSEHGFTGLSPERVLIGKDRIRLIVCALHDMPERMQKVFILYHFEHVTQVEIADRLKMGLSTVEKDMASANAILLNRLREDDG